MTIRLLVLALACIGSWLPGLAHAATLSLTPGDAQVEIGPYLQVLEDREGSLSIGDLDAPDVAGRFAPVEAQGAPNFGYSASAFWLRLDVAAAAAMTRYLEIGYPSLDSVDLFVPQGAGSYQRLSSGDSVPNARRPLPHHDLLFPVELRAGTTRLYLRVASAGGLSVPATLWEPASFHWSSQGSYAAYFLYYGMLLALGLYNLLLYFRLRERVYLYYVLFLTSMCLGIASLHGHAAQFLWPNSPLWTHYALVVGMGLAGLLAAFFSRAFLNLRHSMPRMDQAFVFWIVWYAAAISLGFVSYRLSEGLIALGSIGFDLTALVAGVVCLRRGHAGARFYLLAWTVLLAGSMTLSAKSFGWLPTNVLTSNSLQFGSAIEMLLLSFALADRLQALRRLEHEAQTDPLTGLRNRRSFFVQANLELERAIRHGRRLAVAVIDVDHFKAINDTHGHALGDQVLATLARTLASELREIDVLGRLGGEEFGIVMPETDACGAWATCERIRAALERCPVLTEGRTIGITVSIGVSEIRDGAHSIEKLLADADSALYEAKGGGRNKVFCRCRLLRAQP